MPGEAASALFQVVSQRCGKTAIVLTPNRGVASWGEVLGDTTVAAAMLERLLHRSVVLNSTATATDSATTAPAPTTPPRRHRHPTTTNLTPRSGGDFR